MDNEQELVNNIVMLDSEKKKKKKSEKKKDSLETQSFGSSRGIESMFKNAYRAQLDMIALAATKANIMISLNGLLASVLIVSGAYFMFSEPLLLIPVATLLLTCTTAIVFAVLAARPQVDKSHKTLEDFQTDQADLLIFEQFAKLSKGDYLSAMTEMMQCKERIYKSMTVHVYDLGCSADRKFGLLHISYSAFMTGLVTSVVLLLMIILSHAIIYG